MNLDPDQLEALAAAVSEGTFDAAARALHVTPSAVSQRVKALETSVGQVLLIRSKPVRATTPGETLLRAARQIRALSAEALRELEAEDVGEGPGLPSSRSRSMPTAWTPGSWLRWPSWAVPYSICGAKTRTGPPSCSAGAR